MKIGILSLVPGHNYGGILQSFALKTVLERMGHEVQVLSHDIQELPFWKKLYVYPVRIIRKYVLGWDIAINHEKRQNEKYIIDNRKLLDFTNKHLNILKVDRFSDIKPDQFDAFVVGSDQVWRPRYFKVQWQSAAENAFLAFTKSWKVKRIAYAPSFGVDKWEFSAKETEPIKNAIKTFDKVTVREDSGITLCKQYLGVDVECVLDPTMLLSKDDYTELLQLDKLPKSKGSLVVYILDKNPELGKMVEHIALDKNITPFYLLPQAGEDKPSIEEWVKAFADADMVITDSFHACAFSIIFNKPFTVMGNKSRGLSRFESLLQKFDLTSQIITTSSDYTPTLWNVDYSKVNQRMEVLKEQSIHILKIKK